MALYLVQHGVSQSKEVDPKRGLSQEGRREVEKIAGVAKTYGVKVTSIVHSGKTRAVQTAEILAALLKPTQCVTQADGMDPKDDVEPWVKTLDSDANCMLVGHLPFLERLAARLITGKTEPSVFKLQNGGILCLDKQEGHWVIIWALMPHIS
jgi:phosphohistidine phosphatase